MSELVIAILPALIMLALATISIAISFAIEGVRTTYYLRKNQKAWDEYAKGLDFEQRLNIFPEWLEEQRRINNTDFYYIPRMMGLKDDTKK